MAATRTFYQRLVLVPKLRMSCQDCRRRNQQMTQKMVPFHCLHDLWNLFVTTAMSYVLYVLAATYLHETY